jgi:hypothetical protein
MSNLYNIRLMLVDQQMQPLYIKTRKKGKQC